MKKTILDLILNDQFASSCQTLGQYRDQLAAAVISAFSVPECQTTDPMQAVLPCDITVGSSIFRAGVPFKTLVSSMESLFSTKEQLHKRAAVLHEENEKLNALLLAINENLTLALAEKERLMSEIAALNLTTETQQEIAA